MEVPANEHGQASPRMDRHAAARNRFYAETTAARDCRMTEQGHNNPPDPIDEVVAEFSDTIFEAENWADGTAVENEDQMKVVDALIADMKKATTALSKAKKSATAPLHDVWKAEIARWKPTEDDFGRIKDCLIGAVAPFKAKLAAEKEAARRAAAAEAAKKEADACAAMEAAAESDLEAQREAAAKQAEFEAAQRASQKASKDTVKGLRLTWHHEIENMRSLVNWIAKNDKEAMAEFATEYARRNHRDKTMDGVRAWQERVAA
jgi:hypothetical protein